MYMYFFCTVQQMESTEYVTMPPKKKRPSDLRFKDSQENEDKNLLKQALRNTTTLKIPEKKNEIE